MIASYAAGTSWATVPVQTRRPCPTPQARVSVPPQQGRPLLSRQATTMASSARCRDRHFIEAEIGREDWHALAAMCSFLARTGFGTVQMGDL